MAMIALFSGTYLTKKQALTIPLLIMILSDIFIGLHGLVWWTWGSFLLTSLLGLWLKRHNKPLIIVESAFLSSILFFLVTNFGVWVSTNWYPPTLKGLINCFVMALPFFRNTLLGDFCYLGIFFGGYELAIRLIRKVSWIFSGN